MGKTVLVSNGFNLQVQQVAFETKPDADGFRFVVFNSGFGQETFDTIGPEKSAKVIGLTRVDDDALSDPATAYGQVLILSQADIVHAIDELRQLVKYLELTTPVDATDAEVTEISPHVFEVRKAGQAPFWTFEDEHAEYTGRFSTLEACDAAHNDYLDMVNNRGRK